MEIELGTVAGVRTTGARHACANVVLDRHVRKELVALEQQRRFAFLRRKVDAGTGIVERHAVDHDAPFIGSLNTRDAP